MTAETEWEQVSWKETEETKRQTLERINERNRPVFYSSKNTDLRQLQLFANTCKRLLKLLNFP